FLTALSFVSWAAISKATARIKTVRVFMGHSPYSRVTWGPSATLRTSYGPAALLEMGTRLRPFARFRILLEPTCIQKCFARVFSYLSAPRIIQAALSLPSIQSEEFNKSEWPQLALNFQDGLAYRSCGGMAMRCNVLVTGLALAFAASLGCQNQCF